MLTRTRLELLYINFHIPANCVCAGVYCFRVRLSVRPLGFGFCASGEGDGVVSNKLCLLTILRTTFTHTSTLKLECMIFNNGTYKYPKTGVYVLHI